MKEENKWWNLSPFKFFPVLQCHPHGPFSHSSSYYILDTYFLQELHSTLWLLIYLHKVGYTAILHIFLNFCRQNLRKLNNLNYTLSKKYKILLLFGSSAFYGLFFHLNRILSYFGFKYKAQIYYHFQATIYCHDFTGLCPHRCPNI